MLITVPAAPHLVMNPVDVFPNINVSDLSKVMRIDESLGTDRLAYHIETAMDTVNDELVDLALLAAQNVLTEKQIRTYIRAVLHEATALISDQYSDFDSVASADTRADRIGKIIDKSQRMRRIVQHCIAQLTGRPKNRIKLV